MGGFRSDALFNGTIRPDWLAGVNPKIESGKLDVINSAQLISIPESGSLRGRAANSERCSAETWYSAAFSAEYSGTTLLL